jgi:hypothetical protein
MTLSFPPSARLNKIMLPDVFLCRSDYRQRTEFLKTDSESLFPDGSGHIFNFCLALSWAEKTRLETAVQIQEVLLRQKLVSGAAKPLGSVSPLSRQVFSAQDGARQKLKICPEPSGNKLSEYFLKILYVVCSPNGKRKRPSTQFFGGWWNCLTLGSDDSVWAGGWGSYMRLKLMRIR